MKFRQKMIYHSISFITVLGWGWLSSMGFANTHSPLALSWKGVQGSQDLLQYRVEEFRLLPQVYSREKDPSTGTLVKWKGVRLSHLLDKSLEKLTPEQRAQIDLVILRNESGKEAVIPRYLVSKYPFLIAAERDGQTSSSLCGVVPWTSHPKILEEELPVSSYFLSSVTQIELGNYQQRYGSLFLKRRTDPAAIRGEKFFVQACIGCHADFNQKGAHRLVSWNPQSPHPGRPGESMIRLNDRNRRALASYVEAYKKEQVSAPVSGQATGQ